MIRSSVIALVAAFALTGCVSKHNMARASAQADLGAAYYREGNMEAAIEALRRAEELDGRNWRAMNLLAVTLLAKGLPNDAEEEFKRALKVNPDEAEILVNYGAMSGQPCIVAARSLVFRDVTLRGFWLAKWLRSSTPAQQMALYGDLTQRIASGELHARIGATYDVAHIKEAVAAAARGERDGKILVVPKH